MRALFSTRGILLIWILLTASTGLSVQLRGMATEMKTTSATMVTPINSVFQSINNFALEQSQTFFRNVKFDPNSVVVDIKSLGSIQTRHMMAFVGIVLLVLAVFLYQRAIKSDTFADDLLALFAFYVFVVIELSIVLGLGFNVAVALQRGYVLAAFIIIIAILSWRAGALQDTRLFFRALIEIGILALFLFPDGTIAGTAGFFTSLADFGDYMKKSASVFLVWSIIGAILALTELYALGRRSTRSSNAPVRRVQPAPPAPRPDGQ